MLSDIEDPVVDLPEANELFRHHIVTHGPTFVKQLEKIALEDAETKYDETVPPCMVALTRAVLNMNPRDLKQMNLFSLADFGLSHRAMHCFAAFVGRVDRDMTRNGAASSKDKTRNQPLLVSREDSAYESYDDDFEDLSSPEKSELGLVSLLDADSPTRSRPPSGALREAEGDSKVYVKRNSRTMSPSRTRDKEWIAKGNWTIGERIGSGSFGEVFKGLNNSGKIFAVKRMRITAGRSEELMNLANEIDLMRNMSHPNIVSYIGTKVDLENEVVYIFQEWVSGGSVHSMLAHFGPFQLDVIRTYTSQILLGLEYLHDNGIVHRDIKGGNILVENSGGVKLADFGASAKVAMGDTQESTAIRGTPYFSPPENLYEVKYGRKGDIWALGCTVVEMLTGRPPWQSDTVTTVVQLYMHIINAKGVPTVSRDIPDDAQEFLDCIFKIDPKERPGAKELQLHPFLSPDNYEDSMENSSYGGSSVGSNIYGSSSVDLLRLREAEVWKNSSKPISENSVEMNYSRAGSTSTASAAVGSVTAIYRQKGLQRGLRTETASNSAVSAHKTMFKVGDRVEARFAGLAKWLPGVIHKVGPDEGKYDVRYESGKIEAAIIGSSIRVPSPTLSSPDRSSSNGNPFARQASPSAAPPNPFGRLPASPLPSVAKTPEKCPKTGIVLTNWDAVYSTESGSELPSPFKNAISVGIQSPILFGSSRAARTAPGQSRAPENVELFPEGVLAKKESRRDVRTAGNAPDISKEKRSADREVERRKGSRRAAGKVARAVSHNTLAPPPEQVIMRSTNRLGPAQILRDARNHSTTEKQDNSMSSVTFAGAADDDSPPPTRLKSNLDSSTVMAKEKSAGQQQVRKRDK